MELCEDLGRSMEEKMSRAAPLYSERCIYRVPKNLRRINGKAYTPDVVSIGPFHYRSSGLKEMQRQKWRYLKCFLDRLIFYRSMSLSECLQFAKQCEEDARRCYAEPTNHLRSEAFTEMLVLDAVFIIEFLIVWCNCSWISENDPIFGRPWLKLQVFRDLTLLENQLPFFVIEGLFNLAFGPCPSTVLPLTTLMTAVIKSKLFHNKNIHPHYSEPPKHFLDVVRRCYCPSIRRNDARGLNTEKGTQHDVRKIISHTATELHEAGVTFEVNKDANQRLLEIKFEDGVLKIPHLTLYDGTECAFRNVIAWEQCHYRSNSYMVDYAMFMDDLINTPEDIDLLVRTGIIDNFLGHSGAAATFFNKLGKEIVITVDEYYFSAIV